MSPPNDAPGDRAPAAPRRTGALAAMAIGAAIGLIGGQAIETAVGGADPAFAGAVGGALGAALGRSGWMRVNAARARGRSASLALGVLAGRIVGCALIGVALVGSFQGARPGAIAMTGTQQALAVIAGVALVVATAVAEHRWLRASRAPASITRTVDHGD